VQTAGAATLEGGEAFVAEQSDRLTRGFERVAEGLRAMEGVEFIEPDGAFYAFFRVAGMTDSLSTAKDILAQTKVGLAPGIAFGAEGEGFLRLCFAQPGSVIEAALDRLADYFAP
jgi:aspartate/methionine/tyrosine aminotransferase